MTTVVNIYKDTYDVYIGRKGQGQDGYFGNPYAMRNETDRDECILAYQSYFNDRIENDPEFKRRILELKGKRLGCFCAPKKCHGDIIAQYLNKENQ